MSDDTKFYFGLKLNVRLITPKEIQAWADKKILDEYDLNLGHYLQRFFFCYRRGMNKSYKLT